MLKSLWQNLDYAASVVLFCIGLYAVITKSNLIKKFMGLNVMETAIFFDRETELSILPVKWDEQAK